MRSYIYPKLLREDLREPFATNPDARSALVNTALMTTPLEALARMGMRRARTVPKVCYEPFGVSITEEALHVLRSLPQSVSRSALIQQLLQ